MCWNTCTPGGSGIAEVKTLLNGVKLPRVVRIKTLVCKVRVFKGVPRCPDWCGCVLWTDVTKLAQDHALTPGSWAFCDHDRGCLRCLASSSP